MPHDIDKELRQINSSLNLIHRKLNFMFRILDLTLDEIRELENDTEISPEQTKLLVDELKKRAAATRGLTKPL